MNIDIEKLLQPRYRCIADFPQWSVFKIRKGDILEKKGIHFSGGNTSRGINETDIVLYPDVFKLMNWWEDRTPDEMPKYVALSNPDYVYSVQKVIKFWNDMVLTEDWDSFQLLDKFIPATEQEFISYKKINHEQKDFQH